MSRPEERPSDDRYAPALSEPKWQAAWEEAGVVVSKLDFLGRSYVSPGALTERLWLYLGEIEAGAARGQGGGLAEENEEIEVVELPLSLLAELADRGEPLDLKTRFLIEELRRRRPELFA